MPHPSTRRVAVLAAGWLLLPAAAPAALAQSSPVPAPEVVWTDDSDGDGAYAVLLRDLATGRTTTVLPADAAGGTQWFDPELSPDGRRVVVSTDRGSADGSVGLAVVDRDGSGFRRLTSPVQPVTGEVADVSPAWSPDGATVLFSRLHVSQEGATSSVHTVPAAGGRATAVPGAGDGYTADWSPDGDRVVFAALEDVERGVGNLFVTRLTGTERLPVGVRGSDPAWSPDGTAIALSVVTGPDDRTRADVRQVVTVAPGGGSVRTLAASRPGTARTAAEGPTWAPDGESLLFDLYGYDAAGTPLAGDLWAVDRYGTRSGPVVDARGDQAGGSLHGRVRPGVVGDAPSTYTAVDPVRVLDTRTGGGPVGAGGELRLSVAGQPTSRGPVPRGATAVVLNVTVVAPTTGTDVRVFPAGRGVPEVSNVNAAPGDTVAGLVTVAVGEDGAVLLRNASGSAHLVADLAGWYDAGSTGAGLAVVAPRRVLDTRDGLGRPGGAGRVPAEGVLDVRVTGSLPTADGDRLEVPADATAVLLNVTATGATAATDVRVYPTPGGGGGPVPVVSNLNLRPGQTVANLVVATVGDGGRVRLRNAAGQVHLVADVAGWAGPSATGRFVPVTPARLLDTRTAVGAAPVRAGPGGAVDLKVAGARGIPAAATAALLTLTVTGATASTDVRAYPTDPGPPPTVSSLNTTAGVTRANLVAVRTGEDGRVRVRNAGGSVHLVGDLAGYLVQAP